MDGAVVSSNSENPQLLEQRKFFMVMREDLLYRRFQILKIIDDKKYELESVDWQIQKLETDLSINQRDKFVLPKYIPEPKAEAKLIQRVPSYFINKDPDTIPHIVLYRSPRHPWKKCSQCTESFPSIKLLKLHKYKSHSF